MANDFTTSDLQFYSQDYLSLLLVDLTNYSSYLIQVPVNPTIFDDHHDGTMNLGDLVGAAWPRQFQGIFARRLAVSGPRKVAAILSESNKKIRLLETEVEPEDDEDDEEDDTIDESLMDISTNIAPGTSN